MPPVLPPGQFDNSVATFNAQVPAEGPKVIGVSANFNTGAGGSSSYQLNSYLTSASAQMRSIAGVYIDNSANDQEVAVSVSTINQLIKCPANSQGYFVLFAPKNAIVTMTDPSGESVATVNFVFCNFPIANAVWGVSGDLS